MRKRTRVESGSNAASRSRKPRLQAKSSTRDQVALEKKIVVIEQPVVEQTSDLDVVESSGAEENLESGSDSEAAETEEGDTGDDQETIPDDDESDEPKGQHIPARAEEADVVLSDDSDDEPEPFHGKWFGAAQDNREALREMLERAVEATRKKGNAALRGGLTRQEVLRELSKGLSKYYGYNDQLTEYFLDFFGPEECLEFFEACDAPRPVTIRCNTLKTRRRDLAQTLIARGVNVDVLGDWSKHGLLVVDSTVPVGATPEYLAGHYMLQAASSFLPVLALQPKPDEIILDMAAAPGGKSTYIAQLMRNTGSVVANDCNKTRCFALTANIHRLGVRNAVVTNLDGRKLSEHFSARMFDRVLLDAPCSGSGVFSKDPAAKVKRTPEDFRRLQSLQKELLCQAVDLCKNSTGSDGSSGVGYVVYSTCSISIEENEGVIDYILSKKKVRLVDTQINFGTPGLTNYRNKRFNDNMALTRRFYPHKNNMDGFFVAKLQKYGD